MTTTELFLIALLVIITAPYLVWRLGRTDDWAPLVVVQIMAGIVLGPGVLGAHFPDYYTFVFKPPVIGALNGIAWWAVMLFVWTAGLELDLKSAWRDRRDTVVTATLALATPLALGAIAAALMLTLSDEWIGPKGAPWQFVLGLGMACAVTALPILVLFLEKLQIMREPLGQRILRYGSLDDIAVWGVLALVLLDYDRIGRQVLFLGAFAITAFAIRRLMRRLAESDRWYASLVWLAGVSLAADWAGLHYMVGAFLSGAVLDAKMFDRARLDAFRQTVLIAFMPVFFLSTGLRTTWEIGGMLVFGAAAMLLAASVLGKLIGVGVAARILKWDRGVAPVVGWLLQTKALIMIIFVGVLLDKGVIANATFTALLLMALASTMLTVPMTKPALAKLSAAASRSGD